jgi:hypothetical protein
LNYFGSLYAFFFSSRVNAGSIGGGRGFGDVSALFFLPLPLPLPFPPFSLPLSAFLGLEGFLAAAGLLLLSFKLAY